MAWDWDWYWAWDRDELTQSGTHVIETNFETVKHSSSFSSGARRLPMRKLRHLNP